MSRLEPCPSCCGNVDVLLIEDKLHHHKSNRFIVNCRQCGLGTAKSYPSLATLKAIWNALVNSHMI